MADPLEDFNRQLASLRGLSRSRMRDIRERVVLGLNKIAEHSAIRAKANAPILTGELRMGIYYIPAYLIFGKNVVAAKVVGNPSVLHMMVQHENLTPAGPWKLGPVSAAQPPTPEGGVGGHFFLRVIEFHSQRYSNYLSNLIKTEGAIPDP